MSHEETQISRIFRAVALLSILAIVVAGCSGNTAGKNAGNAGKPHEKTSNTAKKAKGATVQDMSVRDMVGQMFVVSMAGTKPDYYIEKMIRERNIGGVLLFANNMESEGQTKKLTDSLQKLSMKAEPKIPLLIGVDQEGGEVSHAPWVAAEPTAATIGGRGDPKEARFVADKMGTELLRAGVNTDFAPDVDTGFGAAIGTRSFGEDPKLVGEMGAAAVDGFKEAGVVSSAKHFPNHGPAATDSHISLPVINHDAATVKSYDLPPFKAAVDAGVPMVMVGHLVYPAIDPDKPASLSPKAVGMLRDDLGFKGVVITDDLAMKGANGGGPPAKAAVEAVKAGADMLIISSPPQEQADAYDAVVAAVESGEISKKQVQASVERVIKVKKKYSLHGPSR